MLALLVLCLPELTTACVYDVLRGILQGLQQELCIVVVMS